MASSIDSLHKLVLAKDWEAMNLAEDVGDTAAPMLKELLGNHDGEIRDLALGCLVLTGDQHLTKVLAQALSDTDEDVRMRALLALESRYDQKILPELLANLENPDANIRTGVAALIGNLRDSSAVAPLQHRLQQEDDRESARQMRLALAKLGNESLKLEIAGQLDSAESHIRLQGIRDLAYIDDKALAARLRPALRDRDNAFEIGDPDQPRFARVCDAAVILLARWYPQALPFVTEAPRNYTDEEVATAERLLNSLESRQ